MDRRGSHPRRYPDSAAKPDDIVARNWGMNGNFVILRSPIERPPTSANGSRSEAGGGNLQIAHALDVWVSSCALP